MENRWKAFLFYAGIAVFAAGFVLDFLNPGAEGAMRYLPILLIGLGAGLMGRGAVNLYKMRLLKTHPEKAKQLAINEKDERNIRLREKAGYAAWYITMFVLAILLVVFVILNITPAYLLLLGALFIHIVSFFIYISVYNKKI